MNISKIGVNPTETYFPREIRNEAVKLNTEKSNDANTLKFNKWQEEILISALDKLANSIQLDNSHPLGRLENQPIETKAEALAELEKINVESLRNFGSQAQANVSASSFIKLIMEN